MKSITLFIFCLFFACNYSVAQNDTENDSLLLKGNYGMFKTNIVYGLMREYNLFYEFGLKNNNAIELRGGYIHPNRALDYIMVGALSSPYYFHKGFAVGGSFKKYRVRKYNSFWKYYLGYKNEFFDNKSLWLGGWSGSSYANELYMSQRKNIIHLRVEYGLSSKRIGFLKEGYAGLGLNMIHVHTTYHDCRQCGPYGPALINDDEKPYLDNGYYVLPTLHFGFRFGGRFRQGR